MLIQAATEAALGKGRVNLGGGLFKVRIAREGQGKSSGFRVILASIRDDQIFYMYAFAKNESENVSAKDLAILKRYASTLFELSVEQLEITLTNGAIEEIQ